jgi:hypothetical protein
MQLTIARLSVGAALAGLLMVGLTGAASADTASAGNGGVSNVSSNGGTVSVPTVGSGDNSGIAAAVQAAIASGGNVGEAAIVAAGES